LRHGLNGSFGIPDLLSKGLGYELGGAWKHSPKQWNINGILNTTQINETKGCKRRIPFPIDILPFLSFYPINSQH
jgi:hypothetical protein